MTLLLGDELVGQYQMQQSAHAAGMQLSGMVQMQHLALAQMQQTSLANSLGQFQNSLGSFANNCTESERPFTMDVASGRRSNLADDGEKIIERISFWNEIPVVGAIVANRLADCLDTISDRIEELA